MPEDVPADALADLVDSRDEQDAKDSSLPSGFAVVSLLFDLMFCLGSTLLCKAYLL